MFNFLRATIASILMVMVSIFFVTTLWAYLLIWFSDLTAFIIMMAITLVVIKCLISFIEYQF